jgi:hypothetical protein
VRRWRQQRFVSGMVGDWGLLLLALWFFAQLNPAIPFFEAGNFINPLVPVERPNPYDMPVLAPQAIGIALNVGGFALFASLLLDPHRRAMVSILMLLALGFVAKVTMASLMLKAPQLIAWLGPATVIGLAAGVLLFLPLQALSYRWRAFGATLFVFGGGLLSKLNSVYGAFDEMLRLFDWPHGHLVNFASLTRWVHEIWPLAVCLFLSLVFLMPRIGSRMPADPSMKSTA